jgi:hypothetical protein
VPQWWSHLPLVMLQKLRHLQQATQWWRRLLLWLRLRLATQ